jgi:thermitase
LPKGGLGFDVTRAEGKPNGWCSGGDFARFPSFARRYAGSRDPDRGSGGRRCQASFPTPNDREVAKDQIIVVLEEEATQSDLTALNQHTDASTEENLPQSDVNVVDLPNDLTVREAIQRYEASADVEYAEPDFVLQPAQTVSPSDPYYTRLYGLNNTGQTGGTPDADLDAKEAWSITTGSPTTVVAVIDEGVDVYHPDLRGNIWVNTDEVPGNGIDDDRNGYVDDRNGFDFANDDASVYDPNLLNGGGDEHGTHVAGTIAAQGNNGTGVTGVNWRASIMPLKFLGPNGGYTSDAVEPLNYAVANGAKFSNNAWGGGGSSLALQQAISRADSTGHLFVAAAGNDGTNNDVAPHYPSNYTNSNIISVAATDNNDRLASFSNFGASSVDLAAPGVNILSTLPGNRYGSYSGTSMATPHVTGVAVLIKTQNPTLSDGQLKAQILQFVESKNSLQGKVATGGRLNAAASLTQQVAPDAIDPTVSSVKPSPRTRDRTPRITATVHDDRAELSQDDIRFFLDGREIITFSYDASTDRLTYQSARVSMRKHTGRIVVTDVAGNHTTRTWTFRVVQR